VIDGFPRTDVQAASVQALEDSHSHINVPDMLEANALVFLDVSDALVLQRAAALDAQTTAFTGAEPDVFTRRLRAFYDHLNPTLVRFQQAHVLIRLDGSRSPGHVLHHSLLMLRRLFKQRARVHGRLSAAQAASS
jgi:adenylate kinase family enzyme